LIPVVVNGLKDIDVSRKKYLFSSFFLNSGESTEERSKKRETQQQKSLGSHSNRPNLEGLIEVSSGPPTQALCVPGVTAFLRLYSRYGHFEASVKDIKKA
jgi:hypothetical protein